MNPRQRYFIKREDPPFADEKIRQQTYQRVFEAGDGAIVLTDLMNVAGMDRISYSKDSARQTDFNEGKKFMLHHIINLLTVKLTTKKDLNDGNDTDE